MIVFIHSEIILPDLSQILPNNCQVFTPSSSDISPNPPFFVGIKTNEDYATVVSMLQELANAGMITILPHPRSPKPLAPGQIQKLQGHLKGVQTGHTMRDVIGEVYKNCPAPMWDPENHCN